MNRKLLLTAILIAGAAGADTLTLRDGSVVTGVYLGGGAREIRMDLGDHTQTFPIDRVSGIQFDSGSPAANAAPAPAYSTNNQTDPAYAQPQPPAAQASAAQNQVPPPAPAPSFVIPAGTTLTVRMIEPIDSDSTGLGRTYRASVDEPVVVNGQTLIPRGADATTKVVEDTQANKIAGRTAIGLVIQTVSVNGRDIPVTTGDVRQQSASRGKRSAGVIGGGTALGAIIGGLAGGGRGAAIGAVSGAAVGTGAEVLTKGEKVHIPSETRLTFTLSNPVSL